MSRPVEGLPHAASILARALRGERPEWVSARSWGAARALVVSLRADAAEALEDGPQLAADALGVGRSTVARWTSPGGWLDGAS
jgi:hypothetical protein